MVLSTYLQENKKRGIAIVKGGNSKVNHDRSKHECNKKCERAYANANAIVME